MENFILNISSCPFIHIILHDSIQEIVNTLLNNELDDNMMCSVQPTSVEHNVIYVLDLGKLEVIKDPYCDDMGAWKHNGVYCSGIANSAIDWFLLRH